MNVLIFDVETTGLIPKSRVGTLPYITQLSFALYDVDNMKLVRTYNAFIKIPEAVDISEKITQITGINREKLDSEGIDIVTVLETFHDAYLDATIVVSHNLEFDSKMIAIEGARNVDKFYNKHRLFGKTIINMFNETYINILQMKLVCTMKSSKELCNIERVNSRGTYIKFPTLRELYEKLFHTTPKNLHNSMMDVLVCLRCYLKMNHSIEISDSDFYSYISNSL